MKLSKLFQGWKSVYWDEQKFATQRRWLLFWKPRKRRHFLSRRLRVYFWFRNILVKLGICEKIEWSWHELPAKVYINPRGVRRISK